MGIKVTGADEVIKAFDNVRMGYERDVSVFLANEGKKLKNKIQKTADKLIDTKHTGNYRNAVTTQRVYKYYKSLGGKAKDSVKAYGKRGIKPEYNKKGERTNGGFHTHLIEDGHEKVLWGTRTGKRVKAFEVYSDASKEYESKYEKNAEKFIDKITGEF